MQWQVGRERSFQRADDGDHLRSDQFLKQALFVFEVQINRTLGDTSTACDVIKPRCGKTSGGKFVERGVKNCIPPLRCPGSSSRVALATFSAGEIC
jgi:hypothetical protein